RYTDTQKNETNILIVDCIGKLSNLYQYASLAYVGGGFTGKLHNILEPAVFQIPIIIGTQHERFPEAQQLINKGIVSVVSNKDELTDIIEKQLLNQENIAKNAQTYFDENKNVAERIVREIF
ncbi:MAG TPA: 3-deoxy-D-manno-octulosonic acid transferase, partial [Crocinitomicaceae bacterium]|nr:3-deoxy-D-manno-octulosonic acid transferase [Crocinitomicaceae bacterium]